MPKNKKKKNKKKNWDKFRSDNRFLHLKILNYFNKISNSHFSAYCQNFTQITKLKPNQTLLNRIYDVFIRKY